MPYLTDLADACRKSGLKVVEVTGWKTRGHGPMSGVQTIVCHHTATSKTAAGDYPSLGIVRDGRSDLPGPLSQLGLGRNGTVYVIAAGVAYHAGDTWTDAQDNWRAIGIEAEADGLSPWPAAQMDAYARLCRALVDHYGLEPADVRGHKEVARPAGRKIDPNFDMSAFRDAVTNAGDDMFENADRQKLEDVHKWLGADGVFRKKLNGLRERSTEIRKQVKAGAKTAEQGFEELAGLVEADDA